MNSNLSALIGRMTPLLLLMGLMTGMAAGCTPPAAGPLQFDSARIRLPLPGTDKTVGYFEVTNNSKDTIVLVSARSTAALTIEFHTMVQDGDMLRMRRLTEVPVVPGETVSFAPGGNHLMIFGVAELTEPVELVFIAGDGAEYSHSFRTFTLNEDQ